MTTFKCCISIPNKQAGGGRSLHSPPEQISSGLTASRSSRMSEANSVCALNVSHSYQAVQSSAKHLLEFTSTEETLVIPRRLRAPAPPGNNFTCMLVGSCGYLLSTLALYLAIGNATATLHASHCARFRDLCTIRILTVLNFSALLRTSRVSRHGGLEHSVTFRPVAETLAKHVRLRSLPVPLPADTVAPPNLTSAFSP